MTASSRISAFVDDLKSFPVSLLGCYFSAFDRESCVGRKTAQPGQGRENIAAPCSHRRKATAILQGELSRPGDSRPTLYSAQFEVSICANCGLAQFYCQSFKDVYAWLSARMRATGASDLLPAGTPKPKRSQPS